MGKITQAIKSFLSGDIIKYLRKHWKYIFFLFFLAIAYISFGLILALEISKSQKLESELMRSKVKYNNRLNEITRLNRYPNLMELLKQYDIDIKDSETPPIKVEK